jgi:purine nucleosidase
MKRALRSILAVTPLVLGCGTEPGRAGGAGGAGSAAVGGGGAPQTGGGVPAASGVGGGGAVAGAAGAIGTPGTGGSAAAGEGGAAGAADPPRRRVVLDSDANNELDDQHAIAYALFKSDELELEGITVNRTTNGGDVDQHVLEATRVVKLCNADSIPVLKGANGNFEDLKTSVNDASFDGSQAVNFLIERALAPSDEKLLVIPIGKLTNVALALLKEPSIAERIEVVWLGSNYPDAGEYNHENDVPSVQFVMDSTVELAVSIVRYGAPSGTDAVRVTTQEINLRMPGKGPMVEPVEGRSGGSFQHFGDYSVELFNASGSADRALFDMAALAVAIEPSWAESVSIGAPQTNGTGWTPRPDNARKIRLLENYDRDAIIEDFFAAMDAPVTP